MKMDKILAILQKTNDGDNLSPEHLKLVELKRFWKHLTRFYPEQKGTTPSHRAQIMLPGHRHPEGQIINLREELEKL